MKDNEIIKALECCMDGNCEDDCPFRETREHCHNLDNLILDLINRQKAEIEATYKTLDKQILENHSLKAEIAHKNAVIEAVLDTVHDLGDDLARALEGNSL